jgi:hypothetical protein
VRIVRLTGGAPALALLLLPGCMAKVLEVSGSSGPDSGLPRYVCNDKVYPAATVGRRLTPAEYQNAIAAVFGGVVPASAQYPGLYGKSLTGYSTEPALSDVGPQDVQQLMLAAEDVAQSVAANLPALLPCASTSADAACAGTFVSTFARRAYRHTLSSDESAALLATFQAAVSSSLSFTNAIALVTDQMLQMPQFLYVMEGASPTPRLLTSSEIASRLSFFLWDSIPDDPLLAAADADTLTDPSQVQSQAQRLLAVPANADSSVVRFLREWTSAIEVGPSNKDTTVYPFLTASLGTSLNASFDKFAGDQFLNKGTLQTLLSGQDAWVDTNVASFLGVPAPPSGTAWAKVELDATKYAGLMTQPVAMASLAHAAQSSFVLRGKFIREQLLCMQLGSPPANALSVFASFNLPANATARQQSTAILSVPACAACHNLLNPGGLAFENFNGMGQYQAAYPSGSAINPSGTLTAVGSDSIPFTNQVDLMTKLAARPEVQQCFARQVVRFALSRMDDSTDVCAVQALGDALTAGNDQLSLGVLAMTGTDSFRYRIDP